MSTYSVISATRNGTTTDTNPLVNVTGTVDGETAFALVFWAQIQQSAAAGGASAVQALLGPILAGYIDGPPYPAVVIAPSAVAPATFTGNGVEPVAAAMVGTWSQ